MFRSPAGLCVASPREFCSLNSREFGVYVHCKWFSFPQSIEFKHIWVDVDKTKTTFFIISLIEMNFPVLLDKAL